MQPQISIATLAVFDPEQLCETVNGSDFEHVQLSGGRFRGQLLRRHFRDSILDSGAYSRDLLVRGSFPADRITLGFILSSSKAGLFNGMRLAVHDILVIAEGAVMDPYVLPAGTHWVGFQTTRDRLARDEVFVPARFEIAHLSRLSPEVLMLRQKLEALIKSRNASSQCKPEDARVLEDELITGFRRAIDASQDQGTHRLPFRKRARLMRKLEEVIEEHISSELRIPEICAHIGVSQRTLESFCTDLYGMSPRRYLSLRRLNAVRAKLLQAAETDVHIAAVARQYGFRHPGRFAQTYRNLFGELPSRTLKEPDA